MFGKRTIPGSDAPSEVPARPAPQAVVPAPAESLPVPAPSPQQGHALPAAGLGAPIISPPTAPSARRAAPGQPAAEVDSGRSQGYYEVKAAIFNALIEAIQGRKAQVSSSDNSDASSEEDEPFDLVEAGKRISAALGPSSNNPLPLADN